MEKSTAILLLHCPDQPGIITEVTKFITDNQGNIIYLDQYVDRVNGIFYMRVEWDLSKFVIPKELPKHCISFVLVWNFPKIQIFWRISQLFSF